MKLYIANNPFEIILKDLIEFSPYTTHQCRFKILIDLDNEDTWTLGTSLFKDSLISFDVMKRRIGYLQHPLNFEHYLTKENIIIHETDEASSKIGFIFTLAFLFILMFGLFKCANNEKFFQNGLGLSSERRNSLNADDMDDKKKIELIKNRFNAEEYDYDDMKEMKGVHLEIKNENRAVIRDINSTEK